MGDQSLGLLKIVSSRAAFTIFHCGRLQTTLLRRKANLPAKIMEMITAAVSKMKGSMMRKVTLPKSPMIKL